MTQHVERHLSRIDIDARAHTVRRALERDAAALGAVAHQLLPLRLSIAELWHRVAARIGLRLGPHDRLGHDHIERH
jgi:hypothetical protein